MRPTPEDHDLGRVDDRGERVDPGGAEVDGRGVSTRPGPALAQRFIRDRDEALRRAFRL
jgi:hypothetical protein